MSLWLMKSEPDVFGWQHLAASPRHTTRWDGVRNYQARNWLRDDFRRGDRVFFYHSNCAGPGIVGIVRVVHAGYPDPTALDPESAYFDPRSSTEAPRWFAVDVILERALSRVITLEELKRQPALAGMPLVRRGNRLSVMPVQTAEWAYILSLE